MGPTTVDGLPAHVLLVHAVVVLVPLSALLVLLSVSWPAAQRRLGLITPIVALVTLVFVPLTTHAGEWLIRRMPRSSMLHQHASLGDQMIYWSASVFAMASLWWLLHAGQHIPWLVERVPRASILFGNRPVRFVIAGLAAVAAVGSVVLVYRIGETGARSVWG